MKFEVSNHAISVASAFVSRNDVRYQLNYIKISPAGTGAILRATDGAGMVEVYDQNAAWHEREEAILFRPDTQTLSACRLKTARTVEFFPAPECIVNHESRLLTRTFGSGRGHRTERLGTALIADEVTAERFPDFSRIIDDKLPQPSGKINKRDGLASNLILRLGGALKTLNNPPVYFIQRDDRFYFTVETGKPVKVRGVLAAMRGNMPAWDLMEG